MAVTDIPLAATPAPAAPVQVEAQVRARPRGKLRRLLRACDFNVVDFDDALADGARQFIGRRVALADSSVPMFLLEGRAFALGGQSPEQLLAALYRALERQFPEAIPA